MPRGRAIELATRLARAGAKTRGVATSARARAGVGPAIEPTRAPVREVREGDETRRARDDDARRRRRRDGATRRATTTTRDGRGDAGRTGAIAEPYDEDEGDRRRRRAKTDDDDDGGAMTRDRYPRRRS